MAIISGDSHNVNATRSKAASSLDYAKIGVGGSLPPKKSIESINKANSPSGRSVGPTGTAKNPYDPRQLRGCWSPTPLN